MRSAQAVVRYENYCYCHASKPYANEENKKKQDTRAPIAMADAKFNKESIL